MNLRSYECNVKGCDWAMTVHALSAGKAKCEYWRDVKESWPDIPFTSVTCHVIGKPQTSESFLSMARCRGVPFARVGMSVLVGGEPGVIVGNNPSANFNVLFTDGKWKGQTLNCHPQSEIAYLNDQGDVIYAAGGR